MRTEREREAEEARAEAGAEACDRDEGGGSFPSFRRGHPRVAQPPGEAQDKEEGHGKGRGPQAKGQAHRAQARDLVGR